MEEKKEKFIDFSLFNAIETYKELDVSLNKTIQKGYLIISYLLCSIGYTINFILSNKIDNFNTIIGLIIFIFLNIGIAFYIFIKVLHGIKTPTSFPLLNNDIIKDLSDKKEFYQENAILCKIEQYKQLDKNIGILIKITQEKNNTINFSIFLCFLSLIVSFLFILPNYYFFSLETEKPLLTFIIVGGVLPYGLLFIV